MDGSRKAILPKYSFWKVSYVSLGDLKDFSLENLKDVSLDDLKDVTLDDLKDFSILESGLYRQTGLVFINELSSSI